MDSESNSLSLPFVEGLLEQYLKDPSSVPEDWQTYFEQMLGAESADANGGGLGLNPSFGGPSFGPSALFRGNGVAGVPVPAASGTLADAALQHRVDELVRNYRIMGHRAASLDPMSGPPALPPELEPRRLGITAGDLDRTISTETLPGPDQQTVRQIWERLRNTYCRSIGAEFMHISDLGIRGWLQERMEVAENRIRLSPAEQKRILTKLTGAVILERFIQKKYFGAKSFGLEGAESLIPLLDMSIEKAAGQGCDEVVLGMAHRGRLNVLTNVMGKHPRDIFREFEDIDPEHYYGRGDVKYHLGHSCDWQASDGSRIHLSLCFNPSHLEFINPVAEGRVRCKQDRFGDTERRRALCLLIHGDAAFAGEGIVQETLNLSQLVPYEIGGTLHVVVNNQIGFTTDPEQSRSNTYATDIAKMLEIPIFHVNGEDPEAVAQVVDLALEFRSRYQRDVVIDMYCYRRRGHNEGDEPAFTQPLLYQRIQARRPVRQRYLDHLLELGGITREEAEKLIRAEESRLEEALAAARGEETEKPPPQAYGGHWKGYVGGAEADVPDVDTGVAPKRLEQLLTQLTDLPEGFTPNSKITRFLAARQRMAKGEQPLDWSAAEALAFASLSTEGARLRMTGQDSERGTFTQRHAVLHDAKTGQRFMPLLHLGPDQAPLEIYNSPLSEAGVLGFEYGYSLDMAEGLVVWEAQFGDFINAAQVIIDQFLSSAEDKWNRLSGLTLLLPHGFEGQGPEHSSARLERWLSIAAEDNLQIVYPTTPAQYFHLLRRQVLRPLRKPLVVMTPKSLLRHEEVVSQLSELATGTFRRILPDQLVRKRENVERFLLCSGKIYYELAERARKMRPRKVAVVRLEQLYPTPYEELRQQLERYPKKTEVVWVQEEPRNMGAWPYLRLEIGDRLNGRPFKGIYRQESASPATGSAHSHRLEQTELIEQAFDGLED